MTTGERLKNLRTGKGITMKELADAIQVSQSTIYKYENNIVQTIPRAKLDSIAHFLETSVSFLLGIEEEDESTYMLSLTEQILLDQFRRLSLSNQKTVEVLVDRLLVSQDEEGQIEQLTL